MKRKITLEELRTIQLDILNRVDDYCRKSNLRYSLGGGTLLGAVRHKGYIPWDDDIDLMMPRPDYEQFLNDFGSFYPMLELQHYKNNSKCCKPFLKISDRRTELREELQCCGVNIDVFPIDGLPSIGNTSDVDVIESFFEKYDKEVSFLVRSTDLYGIKKGKVSVALKQFVKKIIFPSREKAVQRFQNFVSQYDFETSSKAAAIVGAYGLKEVMDTEIFRHYDEIVFEGRLYKCIRDYDSYLRKHYGNYMTLPPIEQQITHHKFEAYWLD